MVAERTARRVGTIFWIETLVASWRCRLIARAANTTVRCAVGVRRTDMVDIYDPPAILDHDLDRDRPRGRSHLPREPRQATQREVLSDQNTASPTSKVQVSLLPIQKSRQPGTSQVRLRRRGDRRGREGEG